MPEHVYLPATQTPSWWDRVLVHSTDHAIAAIAVVFGLLMAVAFPVAGVIASPTFALIPAVLHVGAGVFLLFGGLLAIAGLHWTGDRVSVGWGVELVGWSLVVGGMLAVSIAFAAGGSLAGWIIPGLLAIGALLRWYSVVLIRKSAHAAVNDAEGGM